MRTGKTLFQSTRKRQSYLLLKIREGLFQQVLSVTFNVYNVVHVCRLASLEKQYVSGEDPKKLHKINI